MRLKLSSNEHQNLQYGWWYSDLMLRADYYYQFSTDMSFLLCVESTIRLISKTTNMAAIWKITFPVS